MADPGADDPPIPQAMLDAAGVVGSWVHDHWAGSLALSVPLARLLGLDPAAAAAGMPLAAFLDRIHPEDRTRVESYLHAVGEAGGPLEAEFRTGAGGRRLLMRGRIERDAAGRVGQGRGIAVDLTETAGPHQSERIVNRMAEHAIALRNLSEALRRPALTARVEGLMLEIGFELARHLHDPASRPRH
ncbi:diguanylate cyclase [Methylobacterium radiodurans]|uniref:Diguanylate cyclase n=1 Tax=Methylobacterium radiodurans TaxID=2202828 RepID=A0A2U8VVB6_9HYPH|nr:diguanylate cyclase [Methylobacterium radiodurans]AWN37318.1 diguanylate cyclase [Methylobacterium radiodurans]